MLNFKEFDFTELSCEHCESTKDVFEFQENHICKSCLDEAGRVKCESCGTSEDLLTSIGRSEVFCEACLTGQILEGQEYEQQRESDYRIAAGMN